MNKRWACGAPGCEKPLAWHARRAAHLLATEGPDAEREFEMDHPDSEEDDPAQELRVTARLVGYPKLDAVVTSLEDASRLWQQYRDGAQAGGSNMTSSVMVRDFASGREVARVSYNGRVWPKGPYRPEMEPLMEAAQGVEHDCMEHAVSERTGGPLGIAYSCGRCHSFLAVG